MNLPPEQESIRAKCFHPSGTFTEFPKEDIGNFDSAAVRADGAAVSDSPGSKNRGQCLYL